jgi:hypothetical protein
MRQQMAGGIAEHTGSSDVTVAVSSKMLFVQLSGNAVCAVPVTCWLHPWSLMLTGHWTDTTLVQLNCGTKHCSPAAACSPVQTEKLKADNKVPM